MSFQSLYLENFRQIARVEIDFHPHLTIITGANATGKSTILTLLSQFYDSYMTFFGTVSRRERLYPSKPNPTTPTSGESYFGNIRYGANKDATIAGFDNAYPSSGVSIKHVERIERPSRWGTDISYKSSPKERVLGIYIPANRALSYYIYPSGRESLKIEDLGRKSIYYRYDKATNLRAPDPKEGERKTANQVIQESLCALHRYGYGNDVIRPQQRERELFEGFQETLRKVLPLSWDSKALRFMVRK